jgi:hypothetical protein
MAYSKFSFPGVLQAFGYVKCSKNKWNAISLVKEVIEKEIEGRIEVTGRGRRRHKQMYDIKERT